MEVQARRVPGDHPDALAMVAAMVAYLGDVNDPEQPDTSPSATPEDFSAPGGAFVCLYADGRPVAGGGVKRLDGATGEVKRMFVVPERRGQGLARRLLGELEAAARDLGYARVRLDTSDQQPHALALYRSAGYREIDDYNGNGYATYWGEKQLR